ncbi:MAG: RNA-dependent ATPase [Bogoriella megaspora]|nr:MAG: RNA-dependent ATPase [Bogoriella megaspora]
MGKKGSVKRKLKFERKLGKEAELIADAFVQRKRAKTLRIAQAQAQANQATSTATNGHMVPDGISHGDESPDTKPDGGVDLKNLDGDPCSPTKDNTGLPPREKLERLPKPTKEERRAMKHERKALKRELKVYNKAKHAGKHRHLDDPYKKMEETMAALGEEADPDLAKDRRKARRKEERSQWLAEMEAKMKEGQYEVKAFNARKRKRGEDSDESSESDSGDNDESNSSGGSDEDSGGVSGEEKDNDDENEEPVTAAAAKSLGSIYVEHPALTSTSQEMIDDYMAEHFISIKDKKKQKRLNPIMKFAQLPLSDSAHRQMFAQFKDPTPIQATAWPYAIAGRDIVGVAETGSGKTLAFGSPCVRHIANIPRGGKRAGIRAVIITPTRELASQIFEYMKKLGGYYKLGVVCLYGGVPKDQQREDLKTANVVIATPGRLQDLIDEGAADMRLVSYLVLDEADRMLETGFEEAIRKIISTMPPSGSERQTLMFTATWPRSIRELAKTFMTDPVRISIGDNPDGELRANGRITQTVEVVLPSQKQLRLLQVLKRNMRGEGQDRILVFCLYKKEAFRVEVFLKRKDFRCVSIHGDLSQQQRETNLRAFKDGYVPIMVATDVASRGLDIPNVNLVVNMTFPLTVEDYVHRIGRTGRAGKSGLAITLFSIHDKHLAGELINVLKRANQKVPEDLMKFGTTVKKKQHENYGAFYRDHGEMKEATKITFDD